MGFKMVSCVLLFGIAISIPFSGILSVVLETKIKVHSIIYNNSYFITNYYKVKIQQIEYLLNAIRRGYYPIHIDQCAFT